MSASQATLPFQLLLWTETEHGGKSAAVNEASVLQSKVVALTEKPLGSVLLPFY